MILETLRAALILGTILTNAVNLGTPLERTDELPSETPLQPVQPVQPIRAKLPSILPRLEQAINPVPRAFKISHGLASWYGRALDRHRTASGEIFDSEKLTAASNSLPMGSRIRVTNLKNGRSVIVHINDRGILSAGRIIDLSKAAADEIGLLRMGVAPVSLEEMAFAR